MLRGLAPLTGAALLAYLLLWVYHSPHTDNLFRLEQIRFQGTDHLNEEETRHLIQVTFPPHLLRLDLERVRLLVEAEPWVKTAQVRRKLPHTLVIDVQERVPVAAASIDGELYVVDAEGVVLDRFGPDYRRLDRPIVKGLRNVAIENAAQENRDKMQLYLRVLRELGSGAQDLSRSVSEIDVSNPEQVTVVPNGEPVQVVLGGQQFLRRFQLFVGQKDLFEEIKKQYGLVESVDVSFENKIIFHTPRGEEQKLQAGVPRNPS